MQIDFLEAKDGSKTFSADGVFYHSSYSPIKEAQRFVETTQFLFNPKLIFFVEPGFSFCVPFFKKRFPNCKIICIRLFDHIFDDEKSWDYVLRYNQIQNFSQTLIQTFGEDSLLSSTVLIWKPAEKLFENKLPDIISNYKAALENCKTLLVTRQFFEKKWLINSCNYIKNIQKLIKPEFKTELDVVVCASGPSLEPCINILKSYQNKVFIICLSSALRVLLHNSIVPDLILTTDGGFWAGEHLKLLKTNSNIPIAAPCEAFIPKQILKKNPILALHYNDESSFICTEFLKAARLPSFEAVRNPTVSGTGLFFSKSISSNNIFFCGLDLAGNKGFQHTQPNELEKNNELYDTRIKTKETRIGRSRYNSDSLQIYRDWFASLDTNTTAKVFRVIEQNKQKNLGNIKDITPEDFCNKINKTNAQKKPGFFEDIQIQNNNTKTVLDKICSLLNTEKWKCQIFPADYISIQNCINENDKELLEQRLNNKIQKLVQKIRKIADE